MALMIVNLVNIRFDGHYQLNRDRQAGRLTDTQTDGWAARPSDRRMGRQRDKKKKSEKGRKAGRQKD